jgi:hypothetical protein
MCSARAALFAAALVGLGACGGSATLGDAGADHDGSASDGGIDGAGLSCSDRTTAAGALVRRAAEEAQKDLSCQEQEDCVVVWATTDCSDTCSALVSRQGAEKVDAAIEEANATVCRGFSEAGCKIVHPPCAVPMRWGCVGGMCSVMTGKANFSSPRWP